MLTQERLKELMEYNPETGLWRWLKPQSSQCTKGWFGDKPNHHSGYRVIHVGGSYFPSHRLAFLYMEGTLPPFVDHKNTDRTDNRWGNLREATRGQNCQNASLRKDNKSGVKGVSWKKKNQKWVVQLQFNKKNKHFGLYDDLELAELVAQEARDKYHGEFANHG